ncbi:Lanthionine synthetase C-like protein [Streptomyces sp. DvalAA-14]|uniref:class III lanthionine synthetase LanKC n=1 Tax=unclassified Streptomyces TaxID=2593676 RepID=UPI00081B9675|nr:MULTISPECIES: class III lanthionine synthetase LanKC [unclassified Streptomyces]MYS20127.1 phosphotransferase [Streptomyces sp. SID4948]SCD61461.1 Lanthionine synthetase C-like protein [Streptomyces sp. DvalAA-14]
MDNRYEAYAYADPIFYDTPRRWGAREEFAAVGRPLPAGWERGDLEIWAVVRPVDVEIPAQGWKIHVSARTEDAEEVLEQVYAYCLRERVTFKFLRGLPILQVQNSKYAARGSSGKFCTLYPVDAAELERCLEGLGALLAGRRGPYILSDLRWGEGPLYLRYGGFAELHCRNEAGERVLALADPDGRLVPDVRGAGFSVPPWAPVPACIAPAVAARAAQHDQALPYTVERVLHFSNAGGVYLARDGADGPPVVLKEARPYAGLDQRGVDAVTRLRNEHDTLVRLAGVPGVPATHGMLKVWEHEFLVQEFVEGKSLSEWLTARYPLIHPDADEAAVAGYCREALGIVDKLERALAAIHARGVVFGDLHPRNLIIRPDGDLCFIDFELASTVEDFLRPALGAAGFAAPQGYTGTGIDRYGLAAIRLWLFLPLAQLPALDPGKADELADAVEDRFPVPPGYTDDIRRYLGSAPNDGRTPRPDLGRRRSQVNDLLAAPEPDWPRIRDSLTAGITAMATPGRADRLFPGDVAQFTHGGLGLAHGAAGVLYALHATGAAIDPEHVRWLVAAAGSRSTTPGLYFGGHGVAYVLDLLGERDAALGLLRRLADAPDDESGPGLAAGAPGIALTLAHFAQATGERGLLDQALVLARSAGDTLEKAGRSDPARPAGLLSGASGAALALIRLYEQTGDTALLDQAETLLGLDLDRCTDVADGTLQVVDGRRVLPYIETGSAGIGLALDALLAHRPDSPSAGYEPAIRRAAEPEFIIQSGLFNGRAGLLGYLAVTGRRAAPAAAAALLDRQRRLLTLHQVSYQGHLAFPGDQLLRLSADLATGSAGVLLALGAALADTPFLPWTGAPRAAPPGAAATS